MRLRILLISLLAIPAVSLAGSVVSDGSLGPLSPATGVITIDLATEAPDGVLNYTTVNIPAGVTIVFSNNPLNTPVFIAATGDVVVDGTIDVSAADFSGEPGPGGGAGGEGGIGLGTGAMGVGPSAGSGGLGSGDNDNGNAGGGAGMATGGLVAVTRTGLFPAAGGPAIDAPDPIPGISGGGGSGGGGGGGRNQCIGGCVELPGGAGGGGGGAVQISTPLQVTVNGTIRANGGHAHWGFANGFGHAGPGGGGSGGLIELYGSSVEIGAGGAIEAVGGAGGGLGTEPYPADPFGLSSGAHGAGGYLRIVSDSVSIDPGAAIAATMVDADSDSDGVPDSVDNCTDAANPDQRDTNGDGFGNLCDADLDGSCAINFADLSIMKTVFFGADPDADLDGSGSVNFADLNLMKAAFFGQPGPSALADCP